MINRREIIYNGDEIISDIMIDVEWETIKSLRSTILLESDYMFLSDQTGSQEWIDYRQFLRNLPENYSNPNAAADAWNEYDIPE